MSAFDKVARVVERSRSFTRWQLPMRYGALMRCHPISNSAEAQGKASVAWAKLVEADVFRLPWAMTFVETEDDGIPTLFGLQRVGKRLSTKDIGIRDGDRFHVLYASWSPGDLKVFSVMSCYLLVEGKALSASDVIMAVEAPGGKITDVLNLPTETARTIATGSFITVALLMQEATSPGNWILKQTTYHPFRPPSAKKIPRSPDRQKWLLITDAERVRYFRDAASAPSQSGQEKTDITPHPRRAHYRRLGDNEDGTPKHTWVRACWVGSTEAEIRGNRYKVELEL